MRARVTARPGLSSHTVFPRWVQSNNAHLTHRSSRVMASQRRFVSDFFPSSAADDDVDELARVPSTTRNALLLLNYHLPPSTPHLWQICDNRTIVCADGGANRLFDEMPGLVAAASLDSSSVEGEKKKTSLGWVEAVRAKYIPRAIVGDLDSVRPEVLTFYSQRGCLCVDLSADQETSDMHKAIDWLLRKAEAGGDSAETNLSSSSQKRSETKDEAKKNTTPRVLVAGGLGGRLDHEMAHLSLLHRYSETNIVLVGNHSTAQLVPPGVSEIFPNWETEGPTCGLVPLAGPAVVTTSGLRWNLESQTLALGSLISTSNEIEPGVRGLEATGTSGTGKGVVGAVGEGDTVTGDDYEAKTNRKKLRPVVRVTTDAPLVWTTELRRRKNNGAA